MQLPRRSLQVGDQIVEINGEPTQGITHTRAIELIQAGGNKVLLLLRPGSGLIPDHGEWRLRLQSWDGGREGQQGQQEEHVRGGDSSQLNPSKARITGS